VDEEKRGRHDRRLSEGVGYDPRGKVVAIALGDLNGDGALDVITGNDASNSLSVLVGGGDGTFADAQTYPAGNTHTVAVVDLDGDGKLDLALVDSGTRGVVSILLGT